MTAGNRRHERNDHLPRLGNRAGQTEPGLWQPRAHEYPRLTPGIFVGVVICRQQSLTAELLASGIDQQNHRIIRGQGHLGGARRIKADMATLVFANSKRDGAEAGSDILTFRK